MWPERVPVLTADDMHKGFYSNPEGTKCCLRGWAMRTFNGDVPVNVYDAIQEECVARFGEESIVETNDYLATPEQSADIWNTAMNKLGYVNGVRSATLEEKS